MGEWNNQYPDPISFSPGNLPQIITHRDLKKGGGDSLYSFFVTNPTVKSKLVFLIDFQMLSWPAWV